MEYFGSLIVAIAMKKVILSATLIKSKFKFKLSLFIFILETQVSAFLIKFKPTFVTSSVRKKLMKIICLFSFFV